MAEDVYKLFEQANDFFYRNDYDKAWEIYKKIIGIKPDHFRSYEKLAKIEISKGNIEQGTEYYEKSLEINPNDANIWNDLGNVHYDKFKYVKAIECYKKAVEKNKDYYWAYYNIGLAINEEWRNDKVKKAEAKEWFEKALAVKADYYPALNELGLNYLDEADYARSKELFYKCIKISSNYKFPYFNIADAFKKTGNKQKSKAFLFKALQIDLKYISANNNMGILYYEEGDYNTAMFYYTSALQSDQKYKYALHNAGLVFDCLEKYRKAYDLQKKSLESDPAYKPAQEEIDRYEKDHTEEIKNQSGINEDDLKPETYKGSAKFLTNDQVNEILKDENIENIPVDPVKENKDGNKTNNGINKEEELFCEKFGRNITKMASEGKLFEVVGRDKEIRSVLEVLLNIKKNNPILVGKAGVGKTAIIEGIAQKIISGGVPEFFKDKKIIEVNTGMIVAGTKFRGEFEERLKHIIDEVKNRTDIILFIDEIHTIIGAGETDGSSLDAANILKPELARGTLRCVGATTTEEYAKYFQKDAALDRRFYKVDVEELDTDSTFVILQRLKPKMEKHYNITVTDRELKLIVDLADEEIKNRAFPDKAIDILEKVFSRTALDGGKVIDELTVKDIVGEFVGIKFLDTEEDKGKRLLNMEKYLKERVLGQDEAIDRISLIIRTTKQKLDLKPYRPDGVFFFAGPTGVGKTYLAKQVASFLYGSESKLFALNMSEFSEPHSVSKLIGSPPGYVGYNDLPFFSSKILENPSSLLLLDEIEKAHPEVIKLFLQVFDEGRITDTKGRVIYFSNVTIIMTSNAMGVKNSSGIGFNVQTSKPKIQLTEFFPAEFVNRMDDVMIFNSISKKTARIILTDIIMKKTAKNFEKRGIELKFDSTFVDYILEIGYSAAFGVRNLERAFEKEVIAAASDHFFKNPDIKVISIAVENGKITVN